MDTCCLPGSINKTFKDYHEIRVFISDPEDGNSRVYAYAAGRMLVGTVRVNCRWTEIDRKLRDKAQAAIVKALGEIFA